MSEESVMTARAPQHVMQGDWPGYVQQAIACRTQYDTQEGIADCRRRLALAYLGSNARLGGRVCQAREPSILTADWLLQLTQRNQLRRDTLYPWLAAALQELESAARRPGTNRLAALQKLAALNLENRAQRPQTHRSSPCLSRIAEIDLGVVPAP
jgi:hypothetical protein